MPTSEEITTNAQSKDLLAGLLATSKNDYATAKRKWTPLAKQGNADAQCNLGTMYLRGDGGVQDNAQATKWLRLAAKQGHSEAKQNLKFMRDKCANKTTYPYAAQTYVAPFFRSMKQPIK